MNTANLEEGDEVNMDVRWFDDREVDTFTIRWFNDLTVKLTGDDGHKYTLNRWDGKVLCHTDDKAGSHRGNKVK